MPAKAVERADLNAAGRANPRLACRLLRESGRPAVPAELVLDRDFAVAASAGFARQGVHSAGRGSVADHDFVADNDWCRLSLMLLLGPALLLRLIAPGPGFGFAFGPGSDDRLLPRRPLLHQGRIVLRWKFAARTRGLRRNRGRSRRHDKRPAFACASGAPDQERRDCQQYKNE